MPDAAEYQIKAAYVFKFLGFVEWPSMAFAGTDAPLTVGVLGAAALADELGQVVATRRVNGRSVAVRRLHAGESPSELHVLFVARNETRRLPGILAAMKERPTLIVTEATDAAPAGSAINFVVVDNKVRFDIALAAFERASLKVSARLLTVAHKVSQGAGS